MAGYSKDELVDLLCADSDNDGEKGDGYECDELKAEAAVEKFYARAKSGEGLPSGVANDVEEAAEHIYSSPEYWEE